MNYFGILVLSTYILEDSDVVLLDFTSKVIILKTFYYPMSIVQDYPKF